MSIVTELTRIQTAKDEIANAITAKGVTFSAGTTLDAFPALIEQIQGGASDEWQPHPDWWDILQIFKSDEQPGYTKRYIVLLDDQSSTTVFPGTGYTTIGGSAWKTSDGQFYTSTTTHTWNTTYDRPCSLGYKTRYIIVYGDAATAFEINHRKIPSLFVFLGSGAFGNLTFGGSTSPYNTIVQAIISSPNATTCAIVGSGFYGCDSLKTLVFPSSATGASNSYLAGRCGSLTDIVLPTNITALGQAAFYADYCLKSVTLPSAMTTIPVSTFNQCYSLQSISIPSGVLSVQDTAFASCYSIKSIELPSALQYIGTSSFSNCYSLSSITIPATVTTLQSTAFSGCTAIQVVNLGTDFNIALNVSTCIQLSVTSMVGMFQKLKDNTGFTAKTLTLGSTNLAKLTQDQKNIAINKNWTLA